MVVELVRTDPGDCNSFKIFAFVLLRTFFYVMKTIIEKNTNEVTK